METKIETITPKMAKEYLEANMVNRAIRPDRVAAYARTMKSGNWQLNGEAIRFNKAGFLIDGQHRLAAIIKADVPVEIVVMTGIDNSVSLYDRGRQRSITDALVIEGMDKSLVNNQFVAVAKLHYYIQEHSKLPSDDEVRDFLSFYAEDLLAVKELITTPSGSTKQFKANTRNAPLTLALMYAYICGENVEKLKKFATVFATGFYDAPGETSAVVCRNDAIRGVISYSGKQERMHALHVFEKAIHDFCKGVPRQKSYNSWDDPVYSNNKLFRN